VAYATKWHGSHLYRSRSGSSDGSSSSGYRAAGAAELSGAVWRKASASTANGDCVEVAHFPAGSIAVRDSKDKAGAILTFGQDSWQKFLDEVRRSPFPAA
jgi:hypothetical protein